MAGANPSAGAGDAQIQVAGDLVNIARSLALEGQPAETAGAMLSSVSDEDAKVLQLAHGVLMGSAARGEPGAAKALEMVVRLRRELGRPDAEHGAAPLPHEVPPAGWYEDPHRRARLRWRDGSAWTARRAA